MAAGSANMMHLGSMITGKEEKEKFVFKRRLEALGLKGLQVNTTEQMLQAVTNNANTLIHLESSIRSNENIPRIMKTPWTYVKDKQGILLHEGLSEMGEYMIKATVQVPSTVSNALTQLHFETTEVFQTTMNNLGKPNFYTGEHILKIPHPVSPMLLQWMALASEGVEIRDFVFVSHTQLYHDTPEGIMASNSQNQDTLRFGTHVWESVDVVTSRYPGSIRTNFKHTGFYVERGENAETCQISFVMCIDKNNKRLKWMQQFVMNVVGNLKAVSSSHINVATAADFGDEMHCGVCLKTFGLFRRRHHCRICTHAICQQCSTTMMIDQRGSVGKKAVRACLPCNSNGPSVISTRKINGSIRKTDDASPRSTASRNSQLYSPESEFSSNPASSLRSAPSQSTGQLSRKPSDNQIFGTERGHRVATRTSPHDVSNGNTTWHTAPTQLRQQNRPGRRLSSGISNPPSNNSSFKNVLEAAAYFGVDNAEPTLARHASAPRIVPRQETSLSRQSSGSSQPPLARHPSAPRMEVTRQVSNARSEGSRQSPPRSEVGVLRQSPPRSEIGISKPIRQSPPRKQPKTIAPPAPQAISPKNQPKTQLKRERVGNHMIQVVEDENGMIKLVNPQNMFGDHDIDIIDNLISVPSSSGSDLIPLLEENLSADTVPSYSGSRPSDSAFRPTFVSITSDHEF
ncbi:hypothetical protein THRCLA_11995 [Thraustotheca clavata]|uniref:FYVE-type domain-containing protein n=1 Tax=Thraustotheca clavata TaxID=74557 RepID=A0A1V9Y4A3_9STRA|nr:hypothetical protein THRCLA_11995 [Thraustotheca clavata]